MLTTLVTAGAIFYALLGVLRSTLEKEITTRGESTAEFLAQASAPVLLKEREQAKTDLTLLLGALAGDLFIVNAMVADHELIVVASLNKEQVGNKLGEYLQDPTRTKWYNPKTNNYEFHAPIRWAGADLGTFVLILSREPLEAALARVTRYAMALVAGIASVILILTLLVVRREIRPLRIMGHALDTIAKGDFSHRVPVERNDEIGELAQALNSMVVRSEIFFHYVDKMVVERLVADESLAQPGGRHRDLAVLFGDMRGYTAMSNRRSADEVVAIVNTYFHLFIECIAHFNGMVDKTMGDAIMAIFEGRVNDDNKKHRERAVLALAYMKVSSRMLNMLLQAHPEVATRCGLEPREWGFAMATGPAIVGNIGSKRRMDYTVCGRVVNLASRLEGLTKGGEVIVDNFTRLQAHHLIQLESLPPVQPKGFSAEEKVVPHRITSLSNSTTRHMRTFMKTLFNYGFVKDKLLPKDLPPQEEHNWCATHQKHLERIIQDTPVEYFFARADAETGRILLGDDTAAVPTGSG